MPIIESNYRPPKLFKNGHVQTIYPVMFRKVHGVKTQRIRLETPDHDFIDMDTCLKDRDHVVILSHGLEGSSVNPYIQGMIKKLDLQGFDSIGWNYRSCSGEMNRTSWFYSASNYNDLELVINWAIKKGYKKISLIGFSFGGSLTGFYLGEKGSSLPSEIISAMLISAPADIEEVTNRLTNWHIGKVYTESFLGTMRKKLIQKSEFMELPGLNIELIKKVRNFQDFDELYTAPVNGFKKAVDYYKFASTSRLLHNIKVPTLILNAANDPFLGNNSYPFKIAQSNPYLFLEVPKSGGHVGFVCFKNDHYWSERRAKEFLKQTSH